MRTNGHEGNLDNILHRTHGRAVYCYATASGPLQGSDEDRGIAGCTKVVGSVGHRLGEGQGKGNGNGIGVRIGVRHGGG